MMNRELGSERRSEKMKMAPGHASLPARLTSTTVRVVEVKLLRVVCDACPGIFGGTSMRKGIKLVSALSLVLAGPAAQDKVEQKKPARESPLACNMLALDAEGRKRHRTVSEQMRAAVKEVQPMADGYAIRFAAEQATILLVSEFIARERLCCPFFRFELIAEQENGPLWLRLRGREGVKEFIEAELGLKKNAL
jgi:hypothetical protein